MSLSGSIIRVCSACPPLSRSLLRAYLRSGVPVPSRAQWIVEDLKRRLVPAKSQVTVGIANGLSLRIDLASAEGREIFYHGGCEPAIARFLGNTLKPGMVFIDAGANLGEISVRAAHLVGPEGKVYSIEASPDTYQNLYENLRLNRLDNVEAICAAVCDTDGPKTFFLGRGRDSGSSSLYQPHDYTGECFHVEGIRLDTLIASHGIQQVDCIKLDVEGAEVAALRGAHELLNGTNPPAILFEYNPAVARRAGWDLNQMRELFAGYGYALRTLEEEQSNGDPDRKCNIVASPA